MRHHDGRPVTPGELAAVDRNRAWTADHLARIVDLARVALTESTDPAERFVTAGVAIAEHLGEHVPRGRDPLMHALALISAAALRLAELDRPAESNRGPA